MDSSTSETNKHDFHRYFILIKNIFSISLLILPFVIVVLLNNDRSVKENWLGIGTSYYVGLILLLIFAYSLIIFVWQYNKNVQKSPLNH